MRPFRPQDLDCVEKLFAQFRCSFRHQDQRVGGCWTSQQVQDECLNAQSLVVCLEAHQLEAVGSLAPELRGVVGVLFYRVVGGDLEVSHILVDSTLRRYGIAKALLCELQEKLREQETLESTAKIFLEVHELNQPAIRLYGSLGFRMISLRPSYYPDGASALIFEYSSHDLLSRP